MKKMLKVYHIKEIEGQQKGFWRQIGVAFVNKDGSLNVIVDVLPIDGKMHIRESEEKDNKQSNNAYNSGFADNQQNYSPSF